MEPEETAAIKPLSGSLLERTALYRTRAEILRAIAEDVLVPGAKETLLLLATIYESMASLDAKETP